MLCMKVWLESARIEGMLTRNAAAMRQLRALISDGDTTGMKSKQASEKPRGCATNINLTNIVKALFMHVYHLNALAEPVGI